MNTPETLPDLAPCPFCGGDDIRVIQDAQDHAHMHCCECLADGPSADEIGDWTRPHAAWNRRADTRPAPVSKTEPIAFRYRNWKGEVADRLATPVNLWFGSTDWHPEPGWLMTAWDAEKDALRDFALADCQFAALQPAPAVEGLVKAVRDVVNGRGMGGMMTASSALHMVEINLRAALAAYEGEKKDG